MGLRMKCGYLALLLSLFSAWGPVLADAPKKEAPKPKATVYDYSLVDLDGKEIQLSTFKGKLLLIVNLASQSIYSDQIDALNELQKTYADKGLVVIGIPSSDFGGQELNDEAALRKYYRETAHATFPIFARASLHGKDEIPLYLFLTNPKQSVPGGNIHWNYTKFLIDREGRPLARFEVDQDPGDVEFHVTVEKALAGKLKKKERQGGEDKADADDDDDDE